MNKKQQAFVNRVWTFYNQNGRQMPWREPDANGEFDMYKILVSEIMLQQTQVERVIPKFNAFIKRFPNYSTLAVAQLKEVLELWSGLGYGRRAKYLHDAAKSMCKTMPESIDDLVSIKGIGYNTAAAVMTYTYNQPYVFVETNIRTVFIHHFFNSNDVVSDEEIAELFAGVLDRENPREFLWAIMDYGSHLKRSGVKNNTQSKHYTKQSKFEGSLRQIRGQILRELQHTQSLKQIQDAISDPRLNEALAGLEKDGLISVDDLMVTIA